MNEMINDITKSDSDKMGRHIKCWTTKVRYVEEGQRKN
jgi:hypothetical protein